MVKELTIVLIQAVHLLHIVSAQLEVKDIKVFGHPGLVIRINMALLNGS